MAKVVLFLLTGALRASVGHAIHTGESSCRRLEDLHAGGHLSARAVIIDASKSRFQSEFMRSLRASAADVMLDTKAAELSEIGRFSGAAAGTPWAVEDTGRPPEPEDQEREVDFNLFGKTARIAAELGVTSVGSSAHLLLPGVNNLVFETLSKGTRPTSPSPKVRRGPGAPTQRSSA